MTSVLQVGVCYLRRESVVFCGGRRWRQRCHSPRNREAWAVVTFRQTGVDAVKGTFSSPLLARRCASGRWKAGSWRDWWVIAAAAGPRRAQRGRLSLHLGPANGAWKRDANFPVPIIALLPILTPVRIAEGGSRRRPHFPTRSRSFPGFHVEDFHFLIISGHMTPLSALSACPGPHRFHPPDPVQSAGFQLPILRPSQVDVSGRPEQTSAPPVLG
jgi:hypothetical protein